MKANGRELTCKGAYHIMDEIKNVCLNEDECYNYVVLLVDAYNNIRDNSPICDNDEEEYQSLVVLGNDDGSKAYVDEEGFLHHGAVDGFGDDVEDWRVIEYSGFCTISHIQMKAMFSKEYDQFFDHGFKLDDFKKGFNVYTCPNGNRFFELNDY